MYNFYGKPQDQLTSDEKKLFDKDVMLVQSVLMKSRGESLIGMNMRVGTQEDVDERSIDRTFFSGWLLGLKNPRGQKQYEKYSKTVEESKYSFIQFVKNYGDMVNRRPLKMVS